MNRKFFRCLFCDQREINYLNRDRDFKERCRKRKNRTKAAKAQKQHLLKLKGKKAVQHMLAYNKASK